MQIWHGTRCVAVPIHLLTTIHDCSTKFSAIPPSTTATTLRASSNGPTSSATRPRLSPLRTTHQSAAGPGKPTAPSSRPSAHRVSHTTSLLKSVTCLTGSVSLGICSPLILPLLDLRALLPPLQSPPLLPHQPPPLSPLVLCRLSMANVEGK